MIQARVQNMRSGWRTLFGVFSAASKVLTGENKTPDVPTW
jgi:brefeldin A-inhibited guanine nucleotide-exchange protein